MEANPRAPVSVRSSEHNGPRRSFQGFACEPTTACAHGDGRQQTTSPALSTAPGTEPAERRRQSSAYELARARGHLCRSQECVFLRALFMVGEEKDVLG